MELRNRLTTRSTAIVDQRIIPPKATRSSPIINDKYRIDELEKEVNRLRSYLLKISRGIIRDVGSESGHQTPSILFSQFVTKFCHLKSGTLRANTLRRIYQPSFKAFAILLGDRSLTEYTIQDVELFKKERLDTVFSRQRGKSSCSPTTVNIQFRTLKSAFNCAVKWQLIDENPFNKSLQIRIPEKPPLYLSRDDFQLLLNAVKEKYLKHIFLFAALTGMRLNEIIHLQWNKVDLESQVIRVENSEGFSTKSGKGRSIPLNKHLLNLFITIRPEKTDACYVFSRRGKRYTPGFISHRFKLYIRALGFNEALHFHSLRHTFASWLVQEGVSLYEIQKLLGHSDIKVTEVYSHVGMKELHISVNKITLPDLC